MNHWMSIEDMTRWAFTRAGVVMANEAHSGLQRCVRTRQVGLRMIRAAHESGVRRLAMEALSAGDGPVTTLPPPSGGYLAQPDMQALISTALDLGWTLWPYEMAPTTETDPAITMGTEFTNRRELEQAQNLARVTALAPSEPLLVWCGNGHAYKEPMQEWVPMGHHFRRISGNDPFVIDQNVTVEWSGPPSAVSDVLATHAADLQRLDGTAAILRDHAPSPWRGFRSVDAIIISTDNTLV
jgi:hypothetical protein